MLLKKALHVLQVAHVSVQESMDVTCGLLNPRQNHVISPWVSKLRSGEGLGASVRRRSIDQKAVIVVQAERIGRILGHEGVVLKNQGSRNLYQVLDRRGSRAMVPYVILFVIFDSVTEFDEARSGRVEWK